MLRQGLGLVGTIPSALFGLPDLIELNLEVNQLEGQLPDPLCSDDTKLEVRCAIAEVLLLPYGRSYLRI
jgi:hypothetical protein